MDYFKFIFDSMRVCTNIFTGFDNKLNDSRHGILFYFSFFLPIARETFSKGKTTSLTDVDVTLLATQATIDWVVMQWRNLKWVVQARVCDYDWDRNLNTKTG